MILILCNQSYLSPNFIRNDLFVVDDVSYQTRSIPKYHFLMAVIRNHMKLFFTSLMRFGLKKQTLGKYE